jgi:heat shock protein HslJ
MKSYRILLYLFTCCVGFIYANASGQDLSKNAETWSGTYRGVLPCQGCEGIQTELTLNKNKSFDLITRRIGKGDLGVKAVSGSFSWNKEGNTILLSGINREVQPWQYRFSENKLTQLDLTGNAYTGENAEKYVLVKGGPSIEEKYWKLVTLYGNVVVPEKGDRKEAHLMLKAEGNRVAGSGGCNTISGDYLLSEGNGIKFSKLVTTKMECPVMDTETEFLKILEMVDGYTLAGDTLQIHKAKMVPVAKFVAVYKKN